MVLRQLVDGVEHGKDVFWGYVGQDVVDLLEDETTAGTEDFHHFFDVLGHLPGMGLVEDLAGVAASAPEGQLVAEIGL